jgi:hypothetical protein
MTQRISKNYIRGKAFTHESFGKAFITEGQSAWSKFMGLKPVSVFACQQWSRIYILIKNRLIFETDTITEHQFSSYSEMMRFLKENPDMLDGLKDKDLLTFHVKGSALDKPSYSRVSEIRKSLSHV